MRKLFGYFAHHRMLVNIIVLLIVLGGGFSLTLLRQETFPSTDLDMMLISVTYPGAATIDVEMNAVVPIEEELQQIVGIEEYTSTILENLAIIEIELDQEMDDLTSVKDEVFRKMQNVPDISPDVEEIRVIDVNPKLMSVYTIGVHLKDGMEGTEADIYKYVDILEKELIRLDPVAEIRTKGYVDPEVHIYVKPDAMKQNYIALNDIVQSIGARNVRSTGGDLQSVQVEQTIVTIGEFDDPLEVGEVIIRSGFDGQRVRVNDVAKIQQGFEEKDVFMNVNKTAGVSISIVKKENTDIIDTIEAVKKYIEDNKDQLPDNLVISPISDNSRTIKSLIDVVISNLISGFVLIFVVLLIFLDTRSAIWTSVGMILIILMTFIYMVFADITFNTISLAAIITVLGMIVDNSIVVSENIFNFKSKGLKPLQAIVAGIMDVAAPMLVSSITTIAAFAPMLMVTGVMGKFINIFPKVVMFAIIASLLQALFILPNQLNENRKKEKEVNNTKPKKKKFDKDALFNPAREAFGKILALCLKTRYIILAILVGVFAITIMLGIKMFENFVLVYDTSADTVIVNIDTGIGTPIDTTKEVISEIENVILEVVEPEELMALYTLIGENVDKGIVSEELGSLAGSMIYLVPSTERERTADDINDALIKALDKTDIESKVQILTVSVKGAVNAGKAVDIKVVGNDMEASTKIKEEVQSYLQTINGVYNIDNNQKPGKTEMILKFNYEKLAQLGITVATVAQEVRTAYNGAVATSLQRLDNEIDFRVQFEKSYTRDENFLLGLLIPNQTGRLIILRDIATIEYREGLSSIQHYNGERAITIEADVVEGETTSKLVKEAVEKEFADVSSRYQGMKLEFAGEVEETIKSLSALIVSLLIAIFVIYLVLLLQFNKIVQPLIVLIIIPFGLIGVLWAFYFHGMPISFMGFIGIIGLSGVVVNNGIVMVDLINRIMDSGHATTRKHVINSIINGAKARFRPVMLTSLTTIIGLLPTVYGIGGSADIIVPIVMAMAYGLLFATFLTLIFLPCIFLIAYDLKLIKPNPKDDDDDLALEEAIRGSYVSLDDSFEGDNNSNNNSPLENSVSISQGTAAIDIKRNRRASLEMKSIKIKMPKIRKRSKKTNDNN